MNKTDLINNVAEEAKISKTDAAEAIEATFNAIEKALKSGDEVRIIGFGSFQVADRAESVRRNPSTGEPMTVPAARVPKFKAGKALRDAVNS